MLCPEAKATFLRSFRHHLLERKDNIQWEELLARAPMYFQQHFTRFGFDKAKPIKGDYGSVLICIILMLDFDGFCAVG